MCEQLGEATTQYLYKVVGGVVEVNALYHKNKENLISVIK